MFLGTFKKLSGIAFLACSLFSVSVWADDIRVTIDTNPSQFTPGLTSAAAAYVVTVSKDGAGTVTDIVVNLSFTGASGVNEFDWSCTGGLVTLAVHLPVEPIPMLTRISPLVWMALMP